jgi:hypothetical protein
MSHDAKTEYFNEIYYRYHHSGKSDKNIILNEFCSICSYNRKYAIRLLNKPPKKTKVYRKLGRHKVYHSPAIIHFLIILWKATNLICSQRLKAVIPLWLPFYYGNLSDNEKELLLSISPRTIDRLLYHSRTKFKKLGFSTTKPGSLIKKNIPIKVNQWDESQPGFIEADTVAHCGGSLLGKFIYSLNIVDIATGWTEARAAWGKGYAGIANAIHDIEKSLPFAVKGFDSDNGNEFINYYLYAYFNRRKVQFTRSREYHKNDNAHIEQKNWTHIRQYLGYLRFDNPDMLPLLNDLFTNQWHLLFNFFIPSVKLIAKERVGSSVVKKHDSPLTPFQRLLLSPYFPDYKKRLLKKLFNSLDPFVLQQQLFDKIKHVLELAHTS